MVNTSLEYRKAIRENTKCTVSGRAAFSDGCSMPLGGNDFIISTVAFDESTSASGTFEIGAAIMRTFSCTLNNFSGKFDMHDFTDAELTLSVKKQLESRAEIIPKGTFYVEQPYSVGSTVAITAYDRMKRFEKPYAEVATTYPATLRTILNDVCAHCGVLLSSQQFDNYSFVVEERPDDSAMTCLDVVSYVAQLAGCYAKISIQGYLELAWYDLHAFDGELADGGTFSTPDTPYSDGVQLDGGNFTNYNSGDSFDGGMFTDERPYQVYAFNSFQVCTDDVVITGIKAVVGGAEYLYGQQGYVLSIENNAFITEGNMKDAAKMVGDKIIGMRFRPFSASALSDPAIESGDAVTLVKNGACYHTYLTHVSYKPGDWEVMECTAETPSYNSAAKYSAQTKNFVSSQKKVEKEISSYDLQMRMLSSILANSLGIYETYETLEDGSTIKYQHDKPTLAESKTIWKKTGDAFAVSTDGGKTWNAGMDSSGRAVVNALATIGLSASWIETGSLVAKKGEKTILLVDVDAGRVEIVADVFSLSSGDTIESISKDAAESAVNAQTQESIMGKLTEGGEQGIYLLDGKIYIGSEFIKTGRIQSKNGRVYFDLDNNELVCSLLKSAKPWDSTTGTDPGDVIIDISKRQSAASPQYISYADIYKEGNEEDGLRIMPPASGDGMVKMYTKNNMPIEIRHHAGDAGASYTSVVALGENTAGLLAKQANGNALCGITADGQRQAVTVSGALEAGDVYAASLSTTGAKNRMVRTGHYGDRLLYSYEMPSPMFGDIGEGETDGGGLCCIPIEDIFSETVNTGIEYQVFLQKEGQGDLWVRDKQQDYFVVEGTPGLKFAWEIKAKQSGFGHERLESPDDMLKTRETGITNLQLEETWQLILEREAVLYETA